MEDVVQELRSHLQMGNFTTTGCNLGFNCTGEHEKIPAVTYFDTLGRVA